MTSVTSRISFRRIANYLAAVFTAGVATMLCYLALKIGGYTEVPFYALLFMGLSFLFISAYLVIWDQKYVATVEMDLHKLLVRGKGVYYWKDVDFITLNTRKPLPGRLSNARRYEALVLHFKGRPPVVLYDMFYANMHELRMFLKLHVLETTGSSATMPARERRSSGASDRVVALLVSLYVIMALAVGFLPIDKTAKKIVAVLLSPLIMFLLWKFGIPYIRRREGHNWPD